MTKLKIAVSAISKNEEQFVKKFIDSAADADLVVIADTGSTDNTASLARELGATVYDISINPWRFDLARNACLALIPNDIDVIISLDLDEVLEPGWREEIERVWVKGETTRLRYKFDWGCGISFYYEKIFAKKGYRFWHPVHEYPVPDLRIKEVYAHTDKLLVSHHPDPTKSRGQYLDLLKLAVTEDPYCPRNAFYYARELTFYNKWIDAVVALNKYIENPKANWANERCYAYRLLGKCYEQLRDTDTALTYYQKACNEAPNTREPWVEKALCHYARKEWQQCFDCANQALTIKDKQAVYTMDPSVWGAKPHDLVAISAYHLGLIDIAIKQGQEAVDLEPSDQRLATNLKFYRHGQSDST